MGAGLPAPSQLSIDCHSCHLGLTKPECGEGSKLGNGVGGLQVPREDPSLCLPPLVPQMKRLRGRCQGSER